MKKMLLIGELNETLHSLNECMSASFKIQMCSVNAKDVKDMIRIIRPAILVINVYDMSYDTTEVFAALKEKYDHMSLAVIGTAEIEGELSEVLKGFPKSILLKRPITVKDVLKACYGLLKLDIPGNESEGRNDINVNLTKKKILVVDDNALVLRNVKKILECDYEVIIVNSGEKALKYLEKSTPELVLLDYDMPGMNGKDMYEIMKDNEQMSSIPVIFLTSVAQRNQIISILKSQPAGYILKPPAKEKLLSVIREVLGT